MKKIKAADVERLQHGIDILVRVFKVRTSSNDFRNGKPLSLIDEQALLFIASVRSCNAKDLSRHLGVPPTTTSTLVSRLVKNGLINRDRTEENRRVVVLSPTQAGLTSVDAVLAEQRMHCKQMLSALECDERSRFIASVETIAAHLTGQHHGP